MPLYRYQGMDRSGRAVGGDINANDIADASRELRGRGLSITDLREATRQPAAGGFQLFGGSIARRELTMLLQQLASLLGSGVTLVRALHLLELQAERRGPKRLIGALRRSIEGGATLSQAMTEHPRQFPRMIIAVVAAGESSGTLDQALDRVATDLEEAAAFRAQVITAFIYPSIVLLATLGASAFLVGYVIPQITPFLTANGGRLPWNTQLLIDISDGFVAHQGAIGLGLLLVLASGALLYAAPDSRRLIDRYKLRLPLLGRVWQLAGVVAFTRTAASLLGSGITMIETLKSVRLALGNTAMQHMVELMGKRIAGGASLSTAMEELPGLFPPMVAGAVRVGEESGELADALGQSATIHKRMLETLIRRMVGLVEPAITIILGGIVGFVGWCLISGMLSMY
jgi:type IV pilus assembly protein PilC